MNAPQGGRLKQCIIVLIYSYLVEADDIIAIATSHLKKKTENEFCHRQRDAH